MMTMSPTIEELSKFQEELNTLGKEEIHHRLNNRNNRNNKKWSDWQLEEAMRYIGENNPQLPAKKPKISRISAIITGLLTVIAALIAII